MSVVMRRQACLCRLAALPAAPAMISLQPRIFVCRQESGLALVNCGRQAVTIERGMRIAQGIFYKFLLADADKAAEKAGRSGGIGSTGQI